MEVGSVGVVLRHADVQLCFLPAVVYRSGCGLRMQREASVYELSNVLALNRYRWTDRQTHIGRQNAAQRERDEETEREKERERERCRRISLSCWCKWQTDE